MKQIPKIVLLFDTARECGRGFLFGVAKYASLRGPWALYTNPIRYVDSARKSRLIYNLQDSKIDGIIVGDERMPEVKLPEEVPTIVLPIKESAPNLSNIVADNSKIGSMAAEHLLERGFRHFAYCGFKGIFWAVERAHAFRERIRKAGYETHVFEQAHKKGPRSWEAEISAISKWLVSLPKPVGLMACNDDLSQTVVEASKISGLYVPEEVAVIGVDNDMLLCVLSTPSLSSIALNFVKAGYKSAEFLDQMMDGKTVPKRLSVIRPTHIITRQSTDVMSIKDAEVASAVRFIRDHSSEIIQVRDVVEQASLSRRALEQRFKEELGRSIYAEIRRARAERIAQLLAETDMTICDIALQLGYSSVAHIGRFFRQEKGMSPSEYRNFCWSR
jgi:LacI family transcriptional regulator